VKLIANCSEIIFRLGKLHLEHDTASMPSFPVEEVARYLISTGADVDFEFVENQGGGGDYSYTERILTESVMEAKKMQGIKDFEASRKELADKIREIEKKVYDEY
jgi:hypothetical protein